MNPALIENSDSGAKVNIFAYLQSLHQMLQVNRSEDLREKYVNAIFGANCTGIESFPLHVRAACVARRNSFWRKMQRDADDKDDFIQDYREHFLKLLNTFLKEPAAFLKEEGVQEIFNNVDAYKGMLARLAGKAFDSATRLHQPKSNPLKWALPFEDWMADNRQNGSNKDELTMELVRQALASWVNRSSESLSEQHLARRRRTTFAWWRNRSGLTDKENHSQRRAFTVSELRRRYGLLLLSGDLPKTFLAIDAYVRRYLVAQGCDARPNAISFPGTWKNQLLPEDDLDTCIPNIEYKASLYIEMTERLDHAVDEMQEDVESIHQTPRVLSALGFRKLRYAEMRGAIYGTNKNA